MFVASRHRQQAQSCRGSCHCSFCERLTTPLAFPSEVTVMFVVNTPTATWSQQCVRFRPVDAVRRGRCCQLHLGVVHGCLVGLLPRGVLYAVVSCFIRNSVVGSCVRVQHGRIDGKDSTSSRHIGRCSFVATVHSDLDAIVPQRHHRRT